MCSFGCRWNSAPFISGEKPGKICTGSCDILWIFLSHLTNGHFFVKWVGSILHEFLPFILFGLILRKSLSPCNGLIIPEMQPYRKNSPSTFPMDNSRVKFNPCEKFFFSPNNEHFFVICPSFFKYFCKLFVRTENNPTNNFPSHLTNGHFFFICPSFFKYYGKLQWRDYRNGTRDWP